MAKVQIKSEKITPFGGIFYVRELQLHQSLRLQVHQRTRQVDNDGKALSAEHLHGHQIIPEPVCSR